MKTSFKTHAALILAPFFWGINPIPMKLALAEMESVPFNTVRLLTGLLTAFVVLLLSREKHSPIRKGNPLMFIATALGFFIFQFNYAIGVKYTSASISSIILATLPVFVVLINFVSRSEKMTFRLVSGVLLSFLGVFLISVGSSGGFSLSGTYTSGVILLTVGEAAYGFYMVRSKSFINRYSISQVLFGIIGISFIIFLFIYMPQFSLDDFRGISLTAWAGTVFSGVFSMALANVLWYYGIRQLGTSRTSIYGNLPPVFGITAGFIFLHETLSFLQVGGALVVAAGILFVNRKKAPEAAGERTESLKGGDT